MAPLFASQRLFRTADDRIVTEDDPDAAFLFAGEGDEIIAADAERFGLSSGSPFVKGDPAEKTAPKPADKQAPKPADKQASPPANKGRGDT